MAALRIPSCNAAALVLGAVSVFILAGGMRLLPLAPNPCDMSYMWPGYVKQALSLPRNYTLYHYTHKTHAKPNANAVPILFVPGNSGSYAQVRSLGGNLLGKPVASRDYVVYTLDLQEEKSALYGYLVEQQAVAVAKSIDYILQEHEAERILLFTHSMGIVPAKAGAILVNAKKHAVDTIISLASPHQRLIVDPDEKLSHLFEMTQRCYEANVHSKPPNWAHAGEVYDVDSIWYHLGNEASCRKGTEDLALISIGAGSSDRMVLESLTSLKGHYPESKSLSLSLDFLAEVELSTDHQAVLWCKQLNIVLVKALTGLFDACFASKAGKCSVEKRISILEEVLFHEEEMLAEGVLPPNYTLRAFLEAAPVWAGGSLFSVLVGIALLEASRVLLDPPRTVLHVDDDESSLQWRDVSRQSAKVWKRFRLSRVHFDPRLRRHHSHGRVAGQCLRFPLLHGIGACLWLVCFFLAWTSPLSPSVPFTQWLLLTLKELYESLADPFWWMALALNFFSCYFVLYLLLNALPYIGVTIVGAYKHYMHVLTVAQPPSLSEEGGDGSHGTTSNFLLRWGIGGCVAASLFYLVVSILAALAPTPGMSLWTAAMAGGHVVAQFAHANTGVLGLLAAFLLPCVLYVVLGDRSKPGWWTGLFLQACILALEHAVIRESIDIMLGLPMSQGYEKAVLNGMSLNVAPTLIRLARESDLLPKLNSDVTAALCYHAAAIAFIWASPAAWRLKYLVEVLLIVVF